VFGPQKTIKKMQRRSDYANKTLVNKDKREQLFVVIPLHTNMLHKKGKGVTIEVKMKPKKE
jgi:hypothetical protein